MHYQLQTCPEPCSLLTAVSATKGLCPPGEVSVCVLVSPLTAGGTRCTGGTCTRSFPSPWGERWDLQSTEELRSAKQLWTLTFSTAAACAPASCSRSRRVWLSEAHQPSESGAGLGLCWQHGWISLLVFGNFIHAFRHEPNHRTEHGAKSPESASTSSMSNSLSAPVSKGRIAKPDLGSRLNFTVTFINNISMTLRSWRVNKCW